MRRNGNRDRCKWTGLCEKSDITISSKQ